MIRNFDKDVPVPEQHMRNAPRKAGRKHMHQGSNQASAKQQYGQVKSDVKKRAAKKLIAKIREYWRGERDEYPTE